MQVSPQRAEKTEGGMRVLLCFQSMVLVGREGNVASCLRKDRISQVREGGGSQGVNMKADPYGEEGFWRDGRSVSVLQKQDETDKRKQLVKKVFKK